MLCCQRRSSGRQEMKPFIRQLILKRFRSQGCADECKSAGLNRCTTTEAHGNVAV